MFNAGPSPQFMAGRGGIPARNGGMKPQPMQPMRKGMPGMGPMPGPINNGGMLPQRALPMPPPNPNGGLRIAPPEALTGPMLDKGPSGPPMTAQPGMSYLGGSPTFDESGRGGIRMPIGMVSSSPNEGVAQPWGMKFGGTPANIGGPQAPPDATPLWQRYAMLSRGM